MVQKVTQTIQVYGASFRVDSEEPLSVGQEMQIVDVFKKYPKEILTILSKGTHGEPPLKLIVSSRDNWPLFSTNFYDYLDAMISQIIAAAFYNPSYNTIFIDSSKETDQKNVIAHELNHAVDDFARTRFLMGGNAEIGLASDLLIDDHVVEDYPRLMSFLSALYDGGYSLFYARPFDFSLWRHAEIFACLLAATPADIEYVGGEKLFIKSRQFLKNYPRIEGVNSSEQFQTNDLPLLLESGPEYRKKR